ncbi:MAG: hypothetical protein FWE46_02045 [Coriobacteriia bacterium]|nr:hypothetical protein [Coriobacteriia bacterium]MCL2537659.1 hypothetical protein [Coriobacteriia bacterium]
MSHREANDSAQEESILMPDDKTVIEHTFGLPVGSRVAVLISNNFKALGIHALLCALALALLLAGGMWGMLLTALAALTLYPLLARKMLHPFVGGMNLFSFSLLTAILVTGSAIVGLVTYGSEPGLTALLNFPAIAILDIVTSLFGFDQLATPGSALASYLMLIVASFLPALLMQLGLSLKGGHENESE